MRSSQAALLVAQDLREREVQVGVESACSHSLHVAGEGGRGVEQLRPPCPATGSPGRGRGRRGLAGGGAAAGEARGLAAGGQGAERRRAAPRARCRGRPRAARRQRGWWRGSRRRRWGRARGWPPGGRPGGAACSCRAGSDLAESGEGGSGRARGGGRRSSGRRPRPAALPSSPPPGSARGASSKIRWALVPLMPKEETPARRGLPVRLPGQRPRSAARPPPPPSRRWRRARRRAGSSAAPLRASPSPS